ncbi:tumor protein D52 isoform X3 [Psammomys obesus]|uniref:tumor protein D52 isoform X3 n=1 Tax=Psammomys obesus TaxID=48139 RepID=UPI002452E12D|nr:tumor protein D52 isoform X3 [Psammomys obesus]
MDCRDMELYEDYQSPFDFNSGVNKNYLYLSPSGNVSPPGSPTQNFGLPKTEPVAEEGQDAVAMLSDPETMTEEEKDELKQELSKVEEEIQTLSQVLEAKQKDLAEIKRKLGITSLQELKQNIARSWQDMTTTTAYKRTSESFSQAGQKASAAFSSVGAAITKKLEDVKNSPTFKSLEEKVENLKYKVGGTKTAGADFGEVLNSAAKATHATDMEPPPEQTQESP